MSDTSSVEWDIDRNIPTHAEFYKKKSVTVVAIEYDGTAERATHIINWILREGGTATYACPYAAGCNGVETEHTVAIQTLEGTMHAAKGDMVIRGVQGEFYPCKPDIFAQTYDASFIDQDWDDRYTKGYADGYEDRRLERDYDPGNRR